MAAFSAAMTIRLCLLLTMQRGPGQGPERGAFAYVVILNEKWAHGTK